MTQAIIGNAAHPEYGVATIPFPIPRTEYANCVALLEALEIGDARDRDCQVQEICGSWPALKRLENQLVNLDELDYLAKRLDSFSSGELAQFQALAEKWELRDMTDLINLSFCCQKATVITYFSDLESVGRRHYLNIHSGCTSVQELEDLDARETALLLIDSEAGTVTPYGVVYDNGATLEPVYDGQRLPCFTYAPAVLTVALRSRLEPDDTPRVTWLYLPTDEEQLHRTLLRSGIADPADFRFVGLRFGFGCRLGSEHIYSMAFLKNRNRNTRRNDMSTVLSRLNAFLDTELEQVLCFDSQLDAERFSSEKSAIFLILPEEDTTKNFMAGLLIQTLARELFALADEHGGKLPRRVVFFCDELGTMPPFDILPLFSAGRSRKLTLVPIIQSLAQLEKNYGKEGAEIIVDNVQDTIFGGFAPNSQTAETLSKALGNRTVLSGSVSQGKDNQSQSLQMMERALMTPDELKAIPKGQFVVMKTGTHPMMTRLRLFLDWGITFEAPYVVPARENRTVHYAGRAELTRGIAEAQHKTLRGQSGKEHIKV